MKELLTTDNFKQAIQQALPTHLKAERFIRVAITALTRTPKLQQCTQDSLLKCLLDLSALGLEPDGRNAHLIPYGQECTLIVDYKGIVQLVRRSGEVSNIHADVVYEGDDFDFQYGSKAFLRHKPDMEGPRQKRKAAYCFVEMKDGSEDFMVWSMAKVDAIRKRSKSKDNGPWVTDYDEMAKKTVFRNQSKWLPLSSELIDKITRDDDAVDIEGSFELPETGSVEAARAVGEKKLAELRRQAVVHEVKTTEPASEGEGASDSEIPPHVKDLMTYRDKIGDADFYRIVKKHGFKSPADVPTETFMALVADMEEVMTAKKEAAKDAAKDKPKQSGFGPFGGSK